MSEKEYIFVGTAQLKTRDYIKYLEKENRDLQEKIDKTIEYIKEHNVIATNKEYLPKDYEYCCSYELLEILGDKENE